MKTQLPLTSRYVSVNAEARIADVRRGIAAADASHCVVYDAPDKPMGVVRIHEAMGRPDRIFADLLSPVPQIEIGPNNPPRTVLRRLARRRMRDALILTEQGTFVGLITRAEHQAVVRKHEKRVRSERARATLLEEQMTQFQNALAHDLSAPLRALVCYGENLQDVPDSERNEHVRKISVSARTVERMVRSLQNFLGLSSRRVRLRAMNIDRIVSRNLAACDQNEFGGTVELTGKIGPARTDSELVGFCIRELLTNAFRWSKAARIQVQLARTRNHLKIRVADNGIGIEPGRRRTLFEIFGTNFGGIDQARGGIGLATVRRAAELLGGAVKLEPTSKGCSFLLTLPIA